MATEEEEGYENIDFREGDKSEKAKLVDVDKVKGRDLLSLLSECQVTNFVLPFHTSFIPYLIS
jgi:hypothetical protein